jgi:hypothetical protein
MPFLRRARSSFAILAVSLTARAQLVMPTSYAYATAPNPLYPDSGGELTDGIPGLSFSNYSAPPQAGPWTGWSNSTTAIEFRFSSAQVFSQIEVGTTRHDGASVGVPGDIVVAGTTFSFTNGNMVNNTRGWLALPGPFTTTLVGGVDTLTLNFGLANSQWLMLDEVQFTAIPEPVHGILFAALVAGTWTLRRRQTRVSGAKHRR